MISNFVPYPPAGIVLAIQYWPGDVEHAMRLARLLADIKTSPREDGTVLAFCRRNDMVLPSALEEDTLLYCGRKFPVMRLHARREGTGHPNGCNQLAASVIEQLAESWRAGRLSAQSVFLIEADGCPLSVDWLDRLRAEHQDALLHGKRVTGSYTEGTVPMRVPHINGSMIMHLSTWLDRLSIHDTPADQAWDLFHAVALMQEAQPTGLIQNFYGGRAWSEDALSAMARETAWLLNTKDHSAVEWAEQTLTKAERRSPVAPGASRPAGTVAWREHAAAARATPVASDPDVVEQAGGFSYDEMVGLLGHRPLTWRPIDGGAA